MQWQVPTRFTVFTPRDVLHTNNYLRGTWRTMLSARFVNEGKLYRESGEPFVFSFNQKENTGNTSRRGQLALIT